MSQPPQAEIGIIGGSGLYSMPGLTDIHEQKIETPFGDPSDPLVFGTLEGRKVVFLARHGKGHRILPPSSTSAPTSTPSRPPALPPSSLVSAVGSLKEEHKPTDFVIPDQFIDAPSPAPPPSSAKASSATSPSAIRFVR